MRAPELDRAARVIAPALGPRLLERAGQVLGRGKSRAPASRPGSRARRPAARSSPPPGRAGRRPRSAPAGRAAVAAVRERARRAARSGAPAAPGAGSSRAASWSSRPAQDRGRGERRPRQHVAAQRRAPEVLEAGDEFAVAHALEAQDLDERLARARSVGHARPSWRPPECDGRRPPQDTFRASRPLARGRRLRLHSAREAGMRPVIDSDQHLFEYRGLWQEQIDPARRGDAIRFVDDPLGHVRVVWRDRVLSVADVQMPGETDAIGERRRRERSGAPAARALRRDPAARLLGPGRAPRPARGARRRRGDLLPELRARLGAHAARRPGRAHGQHGGLEPLVRDGGAAKAGGGCTRWRISRCAIPTGSRRSSRASRRPACAPR